MTRPKTKPARWKLAPLIAHYREWSGSRTRKRLYDTQARKELLKYLKNPKAQASLALIGNALDKLALWHGKSGAHRVLSGDPSGWSHMHLAVDLEGWYLRIERYTFMRQLADGRANPTPMLLGELYRCLAQAIALRNDKIADWCRQAIVSEMRESNGFLSDWRFSPFHPFMAWLYWTWYMGGLPMNEARLRDLRVYRAIVKGWTDDSAFRKALVRACDYHCARSDPDVDENGEFWQRTLNVFPAEILAIMRVRREILGSDVTISHPLMDSPVASVPDDIPRLTEPLLRRVAERVRRREQSLPRKRARKS